ncbi:MAG TPA: allose kinase [Candidatus Coprousia avicola]|nr:allose kinase [Candidatus Coprousia avicola]
MAKRYVGIDMGGTHTRLGVVRDDLTLERSFIVDTTSYASPTIGEGFVELIARFVREVAGEIDGMVIGVPATVDQACRSVVQAPNVEGLSGFALAEMVEQATGIPTVVEKDVNLLLLLDMHDLGISSSASVVGVYFGTGIGNALYLNGDIWRGRHGVAGELGHIPQLGYKRVCGCGNVGCLESAGGGRRLARIHDERFPATPMSSMLLDHADDPEVRELLDAMAIAVASEVNIIDPDEVVIGGGLPAMPGFDRAAFEGLVRAHARKPFPAETLSLRYARQGQLSGVLGAALRAQRAFTGC